MILPLTAIQRGILCAIAAWSRTGRVLSTEGSLVTEHHLASERLVTRQTTPRGHPMRCLGVMTVAALTALPSAASPLTAAELQGLLHSAAVGCPPGAPRLKIERLTIVGASEHNKIRRDMGEKADGRTGQRYAALHVRSGKQVASVASYGPLDARVTTEDLRPLRGTDYCSVDEG